MIYSLRGKIQNVNNGFDNCMKTIFGESIYGSLSSYKWLIFRILSVTLFYLVGGIYYRAVEGWSVIDSIFFMTVTVATIGYGHFHPTSDHSRLFTAFFILYGLLFVLTAVDDFARHFAVPFQSTLINIYYSLDTKAERCTKKIFLSFSNMFLMLVLGTIVFEYNEDWTSAQAFYFTVVTMATVGYGDINLEKVSSRVFAIFFIWTCMVTYATLIQNVREIYILTLSVPTSDRDSSGAIINVSDGDALVGGTADKMVELGTVSSGMNNNNRSNNRNNTIGGGGSTNPLYANGVERQLPIAGNVDVVACLLALLQEPEGCLGVGGRIVPAEQLNALRADLEQLREKYAIDGMTVNRSKQSVVEFIARFDSAHGDAGGLEGGADNSSSGAAQSREQHKMKHDPR